MSTPRYPFGVTLVGFAYNESALIDDYLHRAERLLQGLTSDFELLIMNDGSTDDTGARLDAFAATRPWVRVWHNAENRGTAWCVKRLIPQATKHVFFWQTVDWSYDLTNLVDALAEIDSYDLLQGVREPVWSPRNWLGRSDSVWKTLVSVTNYLLIRLLFRLPLQDYQNVTVYRRTALQALALESESAFTGPEMLLKSWWAGARILEVPTPFVPRERGKGTGTRPRVVFATVHDAFLYWWRWVIANRREVRGKGTVTRLSLTRRSGVAYLKA